MYFCRIVPIYACMHASANVCIYVCFSFTATMLKVYTERGKVSIHIGKQLYACVAYHVMR